MSVRVYHYPGCSTCKRALAWLAAQGVDVETVDIVRATPSRDELRAMWKLSGQPIAAFFNTSGVSYRAANLKERMPSLSDEEKLGMLAADGKLIRRPLVLTRTTALVGFREPTYAAAYKAGRKGSEEAD